MIERVVSGGQTGVDRAALDVAIAHGIPCGGWCPKGRLAEDGRIPRTYPLRETPNPAYEERTEFNVRDSDGTLILAWGALAGGTAFTAAMARVHDKPCLVVDLAQGGDPREAEAWIACHQVKVLNVAGPRASRDPAVYPRTREFLEQLLAPPRRQ